MGLGRWSEAVRERAKAALHRPSPYGPDLDVTSFEPGLSAGEPEPELVSQTGLDLERAKREAMYVQVDQALVKYFSKVPGVEVKCLERLLEEEPDVAKEYLWRLLDPATDKYTAIAALKGAGGYFVRVKRGAKVEVPVQACMFIRSSSLQAPHNLVIVEEGAEATIHIGCLTMPEAAALHAAMSEIYVERGARLKMIMVHAWNAVTHVRPRTVIKVEEGGELLSYYMNLSKVKSLQTYPLVKLAPGARAYIASIILGRGGAEIDVGTKVELEDASAEIVSRVLARDSSRVYARALLSGPSGQGHIECSGLMLSDEARIVMYPELDAKGPRARLTHEASIGKLSEEEINYLISKGFSREEAEGILVRGFMNVELSFLPERLQKYVSSVLDVMKKMATM
ncbi:MAG: SufD family Fe-S cluster assembly protein [Acidilobaceae archaeon]|nr:SufD family Fe-S cluster assembly protein [Acidilobaceae archaeon]